MSRRKPWYPPRLTWPMVLLLAGIGAMTIVAWQASRATRSHRDMVGSVLSDYAKFAAWSYEQHLETMMLGAARDVLGPVNHDPGLHVHPDIPHAVHLATYMSWDDACGCHVPEYGPIPDALLSFELGSDTVGAALNRPRQVGESWHPREQGVLLAPVSARDAQERFGWVGDTVAQRVRGGYRSESRFPFIIRMTDAVPRVLAYTLMPTAWGDTVVYAAEYPASALTAAFEGVLDGRDLLPPSLTARHANRSVLMIEARAASGELLYRSDSVTGDWVHDSRITMPADYGSISLRTRVRPAVASALIIGGAPRSQLPLLLGLMGLAAALTLVAVSQLVKETSLARDRAQFVASVSHELRTPLAQVRLFLDTMRLGRADTPESRAWSLDQMDRETRRLVHLIDNVLLFSRGAGTLLDAPRNPVDLGTDVAAIVEEYSPLAASRRVTFVTRLAPDVAISATRDALRHILLNLLDNAVKYGPAGQTVSVTVARSGDSAVLEVADQGPGIARDDRARIWQPFQRGTGGSAAAAGGSGIGLHLVRELAAGLGGVAGVRDGDGGATFFVSFPLVAA
ncbi:MAG TPA: HAMP domain-containing sensor histidine kinase [Longimicrobiales bacterium]|nr:HAMP domain-containing sensor histidine kinase [Longimicrobiales bacterium]